MSTEAQKRASKKYHKTYIVQIPLKLNRHTDADIIKHLYAQKNRTSYIKHLIREDMGR